MTLSREISWTLSELQQIIEAEELYKSCISSVVLRGDHSGEQMSIHHHFVPCHVLTMVGVICHWSYFRLLVKGDKNVWLYLNVTCRCSTWSVSVMKSQSLFQSSSWDHIFNLKQSADPSRFWWEKKDTVNQNRTCTHADRKLFLLYVVVHCLFSLICVYETMKQQFSPDDHKASNPLWLHFTLMVFIIHHSPCKCLPASNISVYTW